MTAVNVPVGGKTFRKMLIVDTEAAATFKTPEAPLVSDAVKRQDAPARRRRQPAVAQQQEAVPLATSTPLRHAPVGRVLNYEEQVDEQEVNAVVPTPAPQAPPLPQLTTERAPAVVAHVADPERYWITQAGLCIPPNIPNKEEAVDETAGYVGANDTVQAYIAWRAASAQRLGRVEYHSRSQLLGCVACAND